MTDQTEANLSGGDVSANPEVDLEGSRKPVRLSFPPRPAGEETESGGTERRSERAFWGSVQEQVLDATRSRAARDEMRGWPSYAATPLRPLEPLAARLGVESVMVKDESGRFGLGSFKALGGAYAVLRVVQDELERSIGARPGGELLRAGGVPEASSITTVTASAGNHGRSVAWGSQLVGCDCVVVLPRGTVAARAAAIESHGARVEWFDGPYDDAVGHADRLARENGWVVVSDTAYDGYEEVPRLIYEGYTLLADEVLEQLAAARAEPPTHLFIQAGVGGLATGVCGQLWRALGPDRPDFTAVEPLSADCFGKSIRSGRLEAVEGPFDTHMGGLAAGVASTITWTVLAGCLDGAIAIADSVSDEAAEALASGALGAEVSAGPSGAAGVAALLALTRLPAARESFGLDETSRVLTLVTEKRF